MTTLSQHYYVTSSTRLKILVTLLERNWQRLGRKKILEFCATYKKGQTLQCQTLLIGSRVQ
ncbi:ORF1246 [White spot syndrome virus]|uniref:ORF1246 n=1 Tax=White spot syndrome virus TaxID=342409 RepID=A0A2D3I763_9VIRU|nr:ORF1246 [White spot syndrome virus]